MTRQGARLGKRGGPRSRRRLRFRVSFEFLLKARSGRRRMVKAPTLLKLRRAWQAGAVRSLIAPYGLPTDPRHIVPSPACSRTRVYPSPATLLTGRSRKHPTSAGGTGRGHASIFVRATPPPPPPPPPGGGATEVAPPPAPTPRVGEKVTGRPL